MADSDPAAAANPSDADLPGDPVDTPWEMEGAGGELILGLTTQTAASGSGFGSGLGTGLGSGLAAASSDASAAGRLAARTFIIAHGFKGFMGYGMFPAMAHWLARQGAIVHRFNFSRSGMTRDDHTFARPDLFAGDTWNHQVDDLATVAAAVRDGRLAGGDRDLHVVGHSRGGIAVLLAAGRGVLGWPAGLTSIAAPSSCRRLQPATAEAMRTQGFIEVESSRTGQTLRIDGTWLTEQDADSAAHDLLGLAAAIDRPVLLIHGAADDTVPVADVDAIGSALGGPVRTLKIPGANHVLDCVHPMDPSGPRPGALESALEAIADFAGG
ncbi:MAG: alpha/beta hydrolase family protein [Phycisphaerales bacterium]